MNTVYFLHSLDNCWFSSLKFWGNWICRWSEIFRWSCVKQSSLLYAQKTSGVIAVPCGHSLRTIHILPIVFFCRPKLLILALHRFSHKCLEKSISSEREKIALVQEPNVKTNSYEKVYFCTYQYQVFLKLLSWTSFLFWIIPKIHKFSKFKTGLFLLSWQAKSCAPGLLRKLSEWKWVWLRTALS